MEEESRAKQHQHHRLKDKTKGRHEYPSSLPSSSQQNLDSSSVPISNFSPKSPKTHSDRRKTKWVHRKRRVHVAETPEFEVGDLVLVSSSKDEKVDLKVLNGPKSNWVPKNRDDRVFERPNLEMGSLGSAEEGKGDEEDDKLRDGYVSELKIGPENYVILEEEDINVVKILEELRLGIEEPEVSEEQLRINDQLQDDELLATESIYGDNVVILNREGSLRSFEVHIHFEAADEFTISTEVHSSIKNIKFGDAFNVQYLPPFVLTCLLPRSYPSHLPPYFTLSVRWLDSVRISNLCNMLDSIWMDQPGQEVIYQWVEWLHKSSLSYLGIGKEINLGPYGVPDAGDRRAVSWSSSPDVDIPSIMNYNADKCREIFRTSLYRCCICLGEYAGAQFMILPCNHFFCPKCMETYVGIHVKEGTLNKLVCPDAKCKGPIPPSLLKHLLGDEEFERWESLLLQNTLNSMSDVIHCPRCGTIILEDDDHQHAQCPMCFFSFCTRCKDRRHLGRPCMTPEFKLNSLLQRQKSSQLSEDQRRRELEMINELLSVNEIFHNTKPCPSCRIAISRIDGCNHMNCSNCGTSFCYACARKLDGNHFRKNGCQFFGRKDLQREQQFYISRRLAEIQADIFANEGHACPMCRQLNSRVGNEKNIFCWWCEKEYCYSCHYGTERCQEHLGPEEETVVEA